jgi:hypothetical protein
MGTTTANSFVWYDGAVQSSVAYTKSGTTFWSYYYYSGGRSLSPISVNDGWPRTAPNPVFQTHFRIDLIPDPDKTGLEEHRNR